MKTEENLELKDTFLNFDEEIELYSLGDIKKIRRMSREIKELNKNLEISSRTSERLAETLNNLIIVGVLMCTIVLFIGLMKGL